MATGSRRGGGLIGGCGPATVGGLSHAMRRGVVRLPRALRRWKRREVRASQRWARAGGGRSASRRARDEWVWPRVWVGGLTFALLWCAAARRSVASGWRDVCPLVVVAFVFVSRMEKIDRQTDRKGRARCHGKLDVRSRIFGCPVE
nr:unnamed protein product [Digitaria exilis]